MDEGPLRWAQNCGNVCNAVAWSAALRIAERPPHPRFARPPPRTRGGVKMSAPVLAGALRARAMSNSDVERPVTRSPDERSDIRVRSTSFYVAPGFRFRLRSASFGGQVVSSGLRRKKGKRNAGKRGAVPPARIRRAGRATEKAACAAPSALGRARLPAFHHGSAQGVCGPLVRSGPGFVGALPTRRI